MRLITNNWAALILAVTCWIAPAAAQTRCPDHGHDCKVFAFAL
jgi:hypothetical protein